MSKSVVRIKDARTQTAGAVDAKFGLLIGAIIRQDPNPLHGEKYTLLDGVTYAAPDLRKVTSATPDAFGTDVVGKLIRCTGKIATDTHITVRVSANEVTIDKDTLAVGTGLGVTVGEDDVSPSTYNAVEILGGNWARVDDTLLALTEDDFPQGITAGDVEVLTAQTAQGWLALKDVPTKGKPVKKAAAKKAATTGGKK